MSAQTVSRDDAGLVSDGEADLLVRWPHLARPGPQPENQISGDLLVQLARAQVGRRPEPLPPDEVGRLIATIEAHPDQFRDALVEVLAESIALIAVRVAKGLMR